MRLLRTSCQKACLLGQGLLKQKLYARRTAFGRMRFFVFAQLFASKSWESRQGRQTPGREGLFVILFELGRAKSCRWQVFVRRRSPKRFNWIVRGCCFCALVRCLQNLEALLKGFNCCGAKMSLRWAESRFAEPRSSLKKVLIVAVRSCCLGALIRGLENLESPLKRF